MVQKQDSLETIASSSELNSSDLQILIEPENSFVFIKSRSNVSVYCLKTSSFVTNIFEHDPLYCIWLQHDKVLFMHKFQILGSFEMHYWFLPLFQKVI